MLVKPAARTPNAPWRLPAVRVTWSRTLSPKSIQANSDRPRTLRALRALTPLDPARAKRSPRPNTSGPFTRNPKGPKPRKQTKMRLVCCQDPAALASRPGAGERPGRQAQPGPQGSGHGFRDVQGFGVERNTFRPSPGAKEGIPLQKRGIPLLARSVHVPRVPQT